MLVRDKVEVEFGFLFDKFKLGTTVWSPLAGGILSGKYNEGIPDKSRLGSDDPSLARIYGEIFLNEGVREK